MKIEITTTPKNIEMANFLLKQAYDEAIKNDKWRAAFKVSAGDIRCAEKFRKSLLKSYTTPHNLKHKP